MFLFRSLDATFTPLPPTWAPMDLKVCIVARTDRVGSKVTWWPSLWSGQWPDPRASAFHISNNGHLYEQTGSFVCCYYAVRRCINCKCYFVSSIMRETCKREGTGKETVAACLRLHICRLKCGDFPSTSQEPTAKP